ncbi:MAG: thiamine diphosphokinase [Euryarchaeota archaeon]|nr:thiamine diphosphokinase [Euryarchaeota archaeon]
MGHALVIGDFDLPPRPILDPLVAGSTLTVAADGGANRAFDAGIPVDWVVGDLDGILPNVLSSISPKRVRRDNDPDRTDLEKALAFVARRKVKAAKLVGVTGGRLDHTLGTLAILAAWRARIDLEVVDEHFATTVVDKEATFRAPKGTMVSLVAPTLARGVTTSGLRFPLRDHDLPFSPLGIHNEVVRNPVRVRVHEGFLFLMRSHHVRPHA